MTKTTQGRNDFRFFSPQPSVFFFVKPPDMKFPLSFVNGIFETALLRNAQKRGGKSRKKLEKNKKQGTCVCYVSASWRRCTTFSRFILSVAPWRPAARRKAQGTGSFFLSPLGWQEGGGSRGAPRLAPKAGRFFCRPALRVRASSSSSSSSSSRARFANVSGTVKEAI
jgi:hypothetical protein